MSGADVRDAAFDSSIVERVDHRPWPMPAEPWVMTQSWHDLLFAHWPVDASALRSLVPRDFDLDLFDGQAWLGIVPFRMTNVGLRAAPSLPWLSSFPEINVRTYVRVGPRPGVYFFSLDAGRRLAVVAARAALNLPYFAATMRVDRSGDRVVYDSVRRAPAEASFRAEYQPVGLPFHPAAGTLEHFLTERYCLYHVTRRGRPYRFEIHHRPWSLRVAEADIQVNTMAMASGIALGRAPSLLHVAERQDVVAWVPSYVRGDRRSVRNVTE